MKTAPARVVVMVVALCTFALSAGAAIVLLTPLPPTNGGFVVDGLREPATIAFDRYGAPHIRAKTREDAFLALGYVSARDRLFQMDLLRRKTAGRLAEIFGADLVASDSWSRRMGFNGLASRILVRLPEAQIAVLNAYAAGVNQAMRDARMWPVEFTLLRYRPEPWRPQDSLLVALNLADLSNTEDEERAATVMRAALPAGVVDFLTPESDCYNEALAPRSPERCSTGAIPAAEILSLMREADARDASGGIRDPAAPRGSNGWVVSGRLTRDGRAILANDMHLQLEIPNIWAQSDLAYGDARVEGLFLPGLPMIISGTNGHVAWGMTSVDGDFVDLVRLRRDRRAARGSLDSEPASTPLSERVERIEIRDAPAINLTVTETPWGPLTEPVLGERAAIRWTMLDPASTNLNLIEMDRIKSVEEALPLLRSAGTPPLNGLVADRNGAIGWTLMGQIPRRQGFNGLFSEYWGATLKWDGYLSADETPQLANPSSGFLLNANQRMLARTAFDRELGHDFSGGYRAYAISRALTGATGLDERAMATLQLDTRADPYRYYQRLAINALGEDATDEANRAIGQALVDWDGRAETDSRGLPLIVEFRKRMIDGILSPLLARCRRIDPTFSYFWSNVDVPIRRLVESGRNDLAPPPYRDWRAFSHEMLVRASESLTKAYGAPSHRLRWGDVNRAQLSHPLSAASPALAWLLDMPRSPMAGCPQCVRFYSSGDEKSVGANARLVVAPGHESDGLIQMAGGQSGQFGSRHYADGEADWVAGLPHGFRSTEAVGRWDLRPAH